MAALKPKTRAQLEAEIVKLRDEHGAEHRQRCAAEAREHETRAQFADLKERLALSEAEVQRMGGYISRVQEDDVVREPLVQVGDTDGDQQLVPKRKPTRFFPIQLVGQPLGGQAMAADFNDYEQRRRPVPKRHWVTY